MTDEARGEEPDAKERRDERDGAPLTPRKPWCRPVLQVHSIADVTHGSLSSTRIDDGNFFS